MDKSILYKENYSYNIKEKNSSYYFHMDYGTRHHRVNMSFQHFHPFYEIYFLLNGSSNHIIEGKFYPLKAYDIVVLKPFELHKTQYLEGQPCRRLILNFSIDYIKDNIADKDYDISKILNSNSPIYRFNDNQRDKIINIFNSMYLSSLQNNPVKNLKIYSLHLDLLYEIIKLNDNNLYDIEINKHSHKFNAIISFIHENYYLPLSLSYLSKLFYISPSYLSHQFKDTTEFTLTEYIHLTRVKKAQQYLMETNIKSIELSEKCGFGSLSQFNRIFKKICNKSPSEFKRDYFL